MANDFGFGNDISETPPKTWSINEIIDKLDIFKIKTLGEMWAIWNKFKMKRSQFKTTHCVCVCVYIYIYTHYIGCYIETLW